MSCISIPDKQTKQIVLQQLVLSFTKELITDVPFQESKFSVKSLWHQHTFSFMMSQSITFLHKKYSTKTWRLDGKVKKKGKLYIFRICHYKKKKKCHVMKTLYVWKKPFFSVNQIDVHYVQIVFSSKSVLYYFIIYNFLSYMPKGYMKVKLIYFKKSLEGYPYSSTITIIHRSQITRKYRKWKTKSKCNSFDWRKKMKLIWRKKMKFSNVQIFVFQRSLAITRSVKVVRSPRRSLVTRLRLPNTT